MSVLALDLGIHTGWALQEGGIEHGVQVFDLRRGESAGMRFLYFNRWLERFKTTHLSGEMLVVYELAHHRGGAATEIGVGLQTRVQEFCARLGIEYAGVHTATLKKWTTGKTTASKQDMIDAVQKGSGYRAAYPTVTDDNEADALALLHYALVEIVG